MVHVTFRIAVGPKPKEETKESKSNTDEKEQKNTADVKEKKDKKEKRPKTAAASNVRFAPIKNKNIFDFQMGSVVMMSKRKSRNQLKVAKKNCPNIKCIICVLKVPRSSLPVSPIHGRVKHKLKKSVKISEKQEEVTDPENKSKPEVETDTELSCDSLTATPRSNVEQKHEKK